MRISDWSSDVCSSDLHGAPRVVNFRNPRSPYEKFCAVVDLVDLYAPVSRRPGHFLYPARAQRRRDGEALHRVVPPRSEEHTSELQSLMRISYAVFCLKKKTNHLNISQYTIERIKHRT